MDSGRKMRDLSDVNTISLSIFSLIYLLYHCLSTIYYSYSFSPRDFYPSEGFSVTLLVLLF